MKNAREIKGKVLVYPRDSNPYQDLLYRAFPDTVTIQYLPHLTSIHLLNLLLLPLGLIIYRIKGFTIFHLHWVYTFRNKDWPKFSEGPIIRFLFTCYFILFITFVKLLRYKLVWTAHDLLPHGNYFVKTQKVMIFLSQMSDAIIIHSENVIKEMKSLDLVTNRVFVIPIGNYLGIYENTIKEEVARKKLHIPNNTVVFEMFGKIEEYKGVIELIQAFRTVAIPNSKLLLVGKCHDEGLLRRIKSISKNDKNIHLYLQFIPDEDVQLYVNACNIFVYPFKNITTSSSVILAMSFKRTVICPAIGDLKYFPKQIGYFYESSNDNTLVDNLRAAAENTADIKKRSIAAYEYIKNKTWDKSAKLTINVYKKLLRN